MMNERGSSRKTFLVGSIFADLIAVKVKRATGKWLISEEHG